MTMKKTEFTFPSASKEPVDIHAFCYQDERREPVGIVQITHGLSEHMEGFEDLISFLTENGYICAGMDLLGHGKTAGPGCTGIPRMTPTKPSGRTCSPYISASMRNIRSCRFFPTATAWGLS